MIQRALEFSSKKNMQKILNKMLIQNSRTLNQQAYIQIDVLSYAFRTDLN